jgi:hypothetical protein
LRFSRAADSRGGSSIEHTLRRLTANHIHVNAAVGLGAHKCPDQPIERQDRWAAEQAAVSLCARAAPAAARGRRPRLLRRGQGNARHCSRHP